MSRKIMCLLQMITNSVVSATLKATRSIPIVFTWVSDPVGSGFVTNLPHPGGNITGFHNFEPAIGGKWLAFLKQIAPDLREPRSSRPAAMARRDSQAAACSSAIVRARSTLPHSVPALADCPPSRAVNASGRVRL
jgi:putative tryptophan/tyrosine transport system substrate-binding protein